VIRSYVLANKLIAVKDGDLTIEARDVAEGMHAIVSIRHKEPVFKGQAKTKLGNSDAQGAVQKLVNAKLAQWLEENPKEARCVGMKAVVAARARVAASKAREQVRDQAGPSGMRKFGKLADCSVRDPARTEVFIVEGDSAGG
jgi:DNA gyrase subunit B